VGIGFLLLLLRRDAGFFYKKNDKSPIVISDLYYLIRRMIENHDKFLGPKNLIFNTFCLKTPLNII
jgi:hypothetical protein